MDNIIVWHGAQRWNGAPKIKPCQKGCYEHGPGIYGTTHYFSAYKYAKGGGQTLKLELSPDVQLLENLKLPLEEMQKFVHDQPKMRHKKAILDDLDFCSQRQPNQLLAARYLLNLCVNHEALNGEHGQALAAFLSQRGADIDVVSASGQEEWVIILNPEIIQKVTPVMAKEVQKMDYELPKISPRFSPHQDQDYAKPNVMRPYPKR